MWERNSTKRSDVLLWILAGHSSVSDNDDTEIIAVVEIKGAAAADGFVNYAFLSAARVD